MTSRITRIAAAFSISLVALACSPEIDFDVPEGWVETKSKTGRTVFVNDEARADLMIAPLSNASIEAKYALPGVEIEQAIRQTLTQAHGAMLLPMAVEDELEILPVPGSSAPAFYFTLTMPEGRFRTVGLAWLDGTELTMLGSTATREDVAVVLGIMASARAGE